MNISSINNFNQNNNRQSFGAKLHPNSIKRFYQEVSHEESAAIRKERCANFEQMLKEMAKMGDAETVIEFCKPYNGEYYVTNKKLGTLETHIHPNIYRPLKTKIDELLKTLLEQKGLMIRRKNSNDIDYAEHSLMADYFMRSSLTRNMSLTSVFEELRKSGKFDQKYFNRFGNARAGLNFAKYDITTYNQDELDKAKCVYEALEKKPALEKHKRKISINTMYEDIFSKKS